MYKREKLAEILTLIDKEACLLLGPQNNKIPVVIVGGSAFMLRNLTKRPATYDIDILHADNRIRDLLKNYRMINGFVSAYMDQIPYGYEDRLVELDIPSDVICWLTPSLEDLVVMKLYAMRPNDIEDISGERVISNLDWELLRALVYGENEARASALSQSRYQEMTRAFEEYFKNYGC